LQIKKQRVVRKKRRMRTVLGTATRAIWGGEKKNCKKVRGKVGKRKGRYNINPASTGRDPEVYKTLENRGRVKGGGLPY